MSFYLNFRIRILKIKVLWVLPFWESLQKLIYGRLSLLKLKSLKLVSKSVCFPWFRLDYPEKNLDFLFTAFKVTYTLTHSLLFPLYLICTLFEYLFITIPMWRSKKHFWELDLTSCFLKQGFLLFLFLHSSLTCTQDSWSFSRLCLPSHHRSTRMEDLCQHVWVFMWVLGIKPTLSHRFVRFC